MRLAVLVDLPPGTIVRYRGRWAVMELAGGNHRYLWRSLHYWDGPPELVRSTTVVDVPARQGP